MLLTEACRHWQFVMMNSFNWGCWLTQLYIIISITWFLMMCISHCEIMYHYHCFPAEVSDSFLCSFLPLLVQKGMVGDMWHIFMVLVLFCHPANNVETRKECKVVCMTNIVATDSGGMIMLLAGGCRYTRCVSCVSSSRSWWRCIVCRSMLSL